MKKAFKRYLLTLLVAPILMGPTNSVTPPENPGSELVSTVAESQSAAAAALGSSTGVRIKYSLSVENVDQWGRYLKQIDSLAKEVQPLSWNYNSQSYEAVSPEQFLKLSYEEVDLSEASLKDIGKYARILNGWASDFLWYQASDMMPESGEDGPDYIATSFAKEIKARNLDKLYILNSTNDDGKKRPLSIIGTKDLELSYGVSYPPSQMNRDLRTDGDLGRVGESNRIRALKGLIETAKAQGATGDNAITTFVVNKRAQNFEKYGFTVAEVCY
ncbi:MAG: hypothetical protein ACR2PT_18200 [Endozoicomonas sp.]